MRVFIAGIMQGSFVEKSLHGQDYRNEIRAVIHRLFPEAEIYDPHKSNENSLNYSHESGKETFLRHNQMCGSEIDLLVAYVPEASMGTAVEMWEAWKNGATVVTISPMSRNWAVKFLSHKIYPDIASFKEAAERGELSEIISKNR